MVTLIPFGLVDAGMTFCRMMRKVLRGITGVRLGHRKNALVGVLSLQCIHRASDSGSGDPGSILGRVGVLFP